MGAPILLCFSYGSISGPGALVKHFCPIYQNPKNETGERPLCLLGAVLLHSGTREGFVTASNTDHIGDLIQLPIKLLCLRQRLIQVQVYDLVVSHGHDPAVGAALQNRDCVGAHLAG